MQLDRASVLADGVQRIAKVAARNALALAVLELARQVKVPLVVLDRPRVLPQRVERVAEAAASLRLVGPVSQILCKLPFAFVPFHRLLEVAQRVVGPKPCRNPRAPG